MPVPAHVHAQAAHARSLPVPATPGNSLMPACRAWRGVEWRQCVRMLVGHPECAMDQDPDPSSNGMLALHYASGSGAPADIVQRLLMLHSYGAQLQGRGGQLPLHLAASNPTTDPDVLVLLLESFPDGVRHADAGGWLPLHRAVAARSKAKAAELLKAYPDAAGVGVKPGDGSDTQTLPLHMALSLSSAGALDQDLCLSLLAAHPEAARKLGSQKQLPLHMAVNARSRSDAVVVALVKEYPEGVQVPDANGALPLHLAADNTGAGGAEVIVALIRAFPEAAKREDRSGRRPLYHAANSEAPEEVITALMEHSAPDFSGWEVVVGKKKYAGLVRRMVEDSPTLVRRSAMEAACPECRRAMEVAASFLNRYVDIKEVHRSEYARVLLATDQPGVHDHNSPPVEVAIKIMRDKDAFARELVPRLSEQLDGRQAD
ncbi:hypothetical protein FOA52_005140 [Chlamydomonas sp. UWO 241]|nr:hypothetical protein FOA52_005140 [Chlamydomonas sp. UWO 241]